MVETAIRVAVRSRPILMTEAAQRKADIQYYGIDPQISLNNKLFSFDYVFGPNMTNSDVYTQAISDGLQRIFEGYNMTIMAYGQTGSGKTFTMGTNYTSGKMYEDYELGLIPRGLEDLFNGIQRRSGEASFVVQVSFLEVYNEEIYDLLGKRRSQALALREDSGGGVKVANLTSLTVNSAEEALQALARGAHLRSTAATAMNETSSRSHAIFSVHVEQRNLLNHCTLYSKFQLVDLAGSERVGTSRTEGIRFREGISINMGLLSLGNVINALWERNSYVPYRDSKLTRLLMDSLGGNSLTIMIACISPIDANESLKTLYYAARVQNIKNKPKLNVDPPEVQVAKLKEQVQILQSQLYQMQTYGSISGPSTTDSLDLKDKYENLRNELRTSSARVADLTQKLLGAEEKIEKFEKFQTKVELLCAKIGWIVSKSSSEAETLSELSNILEQVKEVECICTDMTNIQFQLDKTYSADSKVNPTIYEEPSESPEELDGETGSFSEEDSENIDSLNSDEIRANHAEIGREICEIERSLDRKVLEIEHIETICHSLEVPGHQLEDVNIMMKKIKDLEKEREELAEALKASEKNAEERQKRYNECQMEIKALEKEVHKSNLILKLKEQNKKKVEALQREILSLKQTRVKLMKKMKEEGNSFRRLQRAKDKEVAQLKQKDRKKELEFSKKTNQLEKQINVLKSRIDQANATKEKLKHALQTKESHLSDDKSKKVDPKKILKWIEHELDIAVCRKLVDEEYNYAKQNADTLEEQFRVIQETAEKLPAAEGKDYLKTVLDLHKKRLAELKETSLNVTGKGDSNIWNRINTVSEAKHSLEALFNKCVSAEVEVAKQREQLLEMQASVNQMYEEKVNSLNADNKTLREKLETLQTEYEDKVYKQKNEHEKKTLEFLKEMNCFQTACLENETCNSDLKEKLQFQAEEIAKLSSIHEDYLKKCQEVEVLQQNLLKAKKGKNIKWLADITSSNCDITAHPKPEEKDHSMIEEYLFDDVAEESFSSLNDKNDPDWRATPKWKQRKRPMRVLDNEQNILSESSDSVSGDSVIPIKRSFSGCKCPGGCRTMRCACKKKGEVCAISCNCNKENCVNKQS